jgi:hypothetical protein
VDYRKTRLVTVSTIATEMGWDFDITKGRLWNHRWLFTQLRRGRYYDAKIIDILHQLYVSAPLDSDPLATYLKEIE